jgi:hypothetical protein
LERAIYRVVGSVIFAALLLGGVQLHLAGQGVSGGVLFASAALVLIWVIFARREAR